MKESWDDCTTWVQALIIAYDQTRQHEEVEEIKALAGSGGKAAPAARKARRK